MSIDSFNGRLFFFFLSTFLHQTCGTQDKSRTIITQSPSPFVFDDNSSVVLTCLIDSPISPGSRYIWEIHPNKLLMCEERDNTSINTCTYKPLLEDAEKPVTCSVLSGNIMQSSTSTQPLYSYPPRKPPSISIEKPGIKTNDSSGTLGPGSVLKCEVRGGRPLVSKILFTCGSPHHPDTHDLPDQESAASYINLQDGDGNITCTCSATWAPRPELYLYTTTESFHISKNETGTYLSQGISVSTLNMTVVIVCSIAVPCVIIITATIIVVIKRHLSKNHRPKSYESSQEANSAENDVYNTLGSCPARCLPGDNDLYDHCSTVSLTGQKYYRDKTY